MTPPVIPFRSLTLYAVLLPLLLPGCASRKPPPPQPAIVIATERTAGQAARQSENRNWLAAADQWARAAQEYALLNDQTNEAVAWHNRGVALSETGDAPGAFQSLEQAAQLNKAIGQTNNWWRDQIALAQLEAMSTNLTQSRLDDLAKTAQSIPDRATRATFLLELGLWKMRQDNPTEAASHFKEAEQIFTMTREPLGLAAVAANRALLLEQEKKFGEAVKAWENALRQYELLSYPSGIAKCLAGKGRAMVNGNDNPEEAANLLHRAAKNFKALKSDKEMRAAAQWLVKCLETLGRNDEARKIREDFGLGA